MSLGNLDVTNRDVLAPPDLLSAVQHVIDTHTPYFRESGWEGDWICRGCDAYLTDAEVRTHTAYEIWERGYLTHAPEGRDA